MGISSTHRPSLPVNNRVAPQQQCAISQGDRDMEDGNNANNEGPGENVEIICNVCKNACNADGNKTWVRCTICPDFDICMPCEFDHFIHFRTKHKFTYPSDPDSAYCDSCGRVFQDSGTKVHQCTVCHDYVLCRECLDEGMHNHHGRLKTLTLEEYLDDTDCHGHYG